MNESPLVSVIVPVFNTEKYLEKCLNSIINQEHTNLEVLIINDGSTDKSEEIAKNFAQKDSRIKVFSKENGGVSSARNIGIENASGDYITFVDADDIIHETYVYNLVNNLVSVDADTITTPCKTMADSSFDDILLSSKVSHNRVYKQYESKEALLALYNGKLEKGINGCQMFKLSMLKRNNIFYDISMSIGEDFDFFARSIINSNKVLVDYRSMYFYRLNADSAVHQSFSIKHYNAIYNVQKLGRSIENQIPGLKKVLDNNLLVNSISYGALMYNDRNKFPNEFEQIIDNINRYKISTLFSPSLKINSRIKVFIVTVFGIKIGLQIVKKLIRL